LLKIFITYTQVILILQASFVVIETILDVLN
jgi:hypothetical protein